MTREERTKLIKHLKYNRSIGADYLITDEDVDEIIKALEQELSVSEDGTLTVNVEDDNKVSRVLVCGDNQFGSLYYSEQEPCIDAISREEAIKPFLVDATEEWTSADIVNYLKSLLSVMPTMIYPQVPGITPIVVPVEEEQGDIQYITKRL